MVTDMKRGIRVASMVTVLAAAALVQGCGGSSGGTITTRFTLSENGQAVGCAEGDEVDIRIDTNQVWTGRCIDGQITTGALSCGVSHTVELALFDKNGVLLSSTSQMTIPVLCGGTTFTQDVVFEICSPGMISTTWSLTENGQPVSCAPGDEVGMRVDTDDMTVTFQCSAMQGVSPPVSGGNHSVSFKLFDKDGNVLSQTGTMTLAVACGATQPTPKVTFSLTP
jgi:hypothetical protein